MVGREELCYRVSALVYRTSHLSATRKRLDSGFFSGSTGLTLLSLSHENRQVYTKFASIAQVFGGKYSAGRSSRSFEGSIRTVGHGILSLLAAFETPQNTQGSSSRTRMAKLALWQSFQRTKVGSQSGSSQEKGRKQNRKPATRDTGSRRVDSKGLELSSRMGPH